MKRKGILRRALLVFLALITLMSCAMTGFALYWDGSGTSGGSAGSGAASSYTIAYSPDYNNVVGYRFTGLDAATSPHKKTGYVDIFCSSGPAFRDRVMPRRSKTDYYYHYQQTSSWESALSSISSNDMSDAYIASDLGFDTELPYKVSDIAAKMEVWQDNKKNLNIVAKLVGFANGTDSMYEGDLIVVEPLFSVCMDGTRMAMTVTEMADYGRVNYQDNASVGGTGGDAGTFSYISRFTNACFPQILYTDDNGTTGLPFKDATAIGTAWENRKSFADLINYGYGIGVCYQEVNNSRKPDLAVYEFLYRDSSGVYYDPSALPVGKTIYVYVRIKNNTPSYGTLRYNLYGMFGQASSTHFASSQMQFCYSLTQTGQHGLYTNWTTSTANSKMQCAAGIYGYSQYYIGSVSSSSATSVTKYIHIAAYLEGYTSSATSVESSLTNNYKTSGYKFVVDRDLEALSIIMKDDTGTEFPKTNYVYQIPYGSNVRVYLQCKSNYGPAQAWLYGKRTSSSSYNWAMNEFTNDYRFLIASKALGMSPQIDTFQAVNTGSQTYSGALYFAGAYMSAAIETNPDNNVISQGYKILDPIVYTITCDKQGGSGGTSTFYEMYKLKYYENTSTKASIGGITKPTRNGYEFDGYYTSTGGNGSQIIDADGNLVVNPTYFTANTTIYAKWKATSTTVTVNHYIMNTDGSTYTKNETNSYTVNIGTTITLSSYAKSYTGFTYSYGQVGSTTKTTHSVTGATTVNLYYTRNKYTVTLNSGTGISGTSGGGSYYHGVTVNIDATVKTGYHWNNWTGTYTLATKSTSFTMPTSNVTLTANAIANTYTVVYNGNGNTGGSTANSTHTYDVAKNLTANGYTKTGYYFAGWNTAANGSGTSYADKQSVINLTAVNGGTVTLYAQWKPYTLTINYYSNYATNSFNNPLNAVGSNKNVVVRQYVVKYDDPMPDGLHDYSYSTAGTYLYRNRWYSNGHWNTKTDGSGISVDQGTGFTYAQDLAYTLGVPISDKHQTINVYPEWTPHYDVELTDIFFKAYDSNGNLYTLDATQQMNIPIGTKVYVYYTYKNRSPVEVNITGYNTSGSAISYNGSTNYNIPGWDATLTVTAGSFIATPLGVANMSGSVYINGIAVSNESTDIDGNAKTNNTRTENYHVKFDVEIVDIYFTDYEGNLINMNAGIPVNSEVVIHHIYRNNSSIDITVNGYDNAGNKITYNGTQKFTIPAYGTIDIIAGEMRTPSEPGIYSIGGAVYRDGKTAATEKDEWDLDNNVIGTINGVNGAKDKHYTTEIGPYLTPIAPNAAYREGTDVITSYYIYNPTANNYTPDSPILVRIKIYDTYSGNLITEMTQTTVCPANAILTPEDGGDPNNMAQIVYFKWHVPYLENYNDIKIVADLDLPEYSYWWGRVSRNYDYGIWGINYTPDTSYEDKQPAGWTKPGSVADAKGNASWGVWEYINGEFVYQTYGIEATGGKLVLTPQSKTAYEENYMWYMKAGYGFTAEATIAKIGKFGGTTSKKPSTDAYTGAQYAYMYYPEFQYQIGSNTIDTMENVDGKWQLFEFLNYGRVHFTPIWYPDGVYDAVMVQSDIWTPKGMIITQEVSSVIIEGDMYDDWYVQGQG